MMQPGDLYTMVQRARLQHGKAHVFKRRNQVVMAGKKIKAGGMCEAVRFRGSGRSLRYTVRIGAGEIGRADCTAAAAPEDLHVGF